MCKTSTYLMINPCFFNLNLRAPLSYTFICMIPLSSWFHLSVSLLQLSISKVKRAFCPDLFYLLHYLFHCIGSHYWITKVRNLIFLTSFPHSSQLLYLVRGLSLVFLNLTLPFHSNVNCFSSGNCLFSLGFVQSPP